MSVSVVYDMESLCKVCWIYYLHKIQKLTQIINLFFFLSTSSFQDDGEDD